MPSNLLKSSPVDKSPPVIVLPANIVEIQVDGVQEHVDIHQQLEVISLEEYENLTTAISKYTPHSDPQLYDPLGQQSELSPGSFTTPGKTGRRGKLLKRSIKNSQKEIGKKNGDPTPKKGTAGRNSKKVSQPVVNLPQAVVRILDDYKISEAPPRPNAAYIRFIERTPEELAETLEYDLDEEDVAWLEIINKLRAKDNLPQISPDCLEPIIDRLEKESFYMSSGMDQGPLIDDDAVCCICNDGECQNANAILFCDMCNLAVHQECYGVPYIPEGQWLCRRCFFSPSRPVECVLCPNTGGAFKQTECKRWAHVVCAIWIPEVCFANTVFLEPIDNINQIPNARWKLACFICKQKGRGACIQCMKGNCYTAFHVTCAQQAGLCMRMDPDNNSGVKKRAWCPSHAPEDFVPAVKDLGNDDRIRCVRKMLAEKRCAKPVVLVPTIAPEFIAEITNQFKFRKNDTFMKNVMAYWKLKRYSRNGVPLLRRLQISNSSACKSSRRDDAPQGEVEAQKYHDTMRIRQHLERGRLLCELTRKREKTKREQIYTSCNVWDYRIQPFNHYLNSIIENLVSHDTKFIFTQPVNPEAVPDYLGIIEKPMDLSTMRTKVYDFKYPTIDDLQADFELMISNCMRYNNKGTVFYRTAMNMQEYGGLVFREAKRKSLRMGFTPGGLMSDRPPPEYTAPEEMVTDGKILVEIERTLENEERHQMDHDEHIALLRKIMDRSMLLSNASTRSKKFNRIRMEINRVKKKQRAEEEGEESGAKDVSSMDEDEPPSVQTVEGESSEAGDADGDNGARRSQIRTRLRSTDQHESQPPLLRRAVPSKEQFTLRMSRRLSRSSESVVSVQQQPVEIAYDSPDITSPPVTRTPQKQRVVNSLSVSPSSSCRGRGRPPKFVVQRGQGRASCPRRASQSASPPFRQSTTLQNSSPQSSPSKNNVRRGTFRGRAPKLRSITRKALRRSTRVIHRPGEANVLSPVSKPSPEKELPGSTRQASPSGRSVSPAKSSRSSRHVSPTLASPLRSLPTRGVVQTSPNLGSPQRSHPPRECSGMSLQSPTITTPAKSNKVNDHVRIIRAPREPSPILGSPLKPHQLYMVEKALIRRQQEAATVATNQQQQRSPKAAARIQPPRQASPTASPPTSQKKVTVTPRTRSRPVRTKPIVEKSSPMIRTSPGSSKSMEAAAKSVVCEERLSPSRPARLKVRACRPSERREILARHNAQKKNHEVTVMMASNRLREAVGAVVRGDDRRNSVGKGSPILPSLRPATVRKPAVNNEKDASPSRRPCPTQQGPAGAVGRRRKSMNADQNGPLLTASNTTSGAGGKVTVPERRKSPIGVQNLNGISSSALSPLRNQVSNQGERRAAGKKRPRRSAAAKGHGAQGNVGHHNNNIVGGSGGGSVHHHHHHSHHHQPRKTDSFSVYRSGGDHDINSYSEESMSDDEDEVEEEEDDEEDKDGGEEDEEEEEDDDEDEEQEEEKGNKRKHASTSEGEENEEEDDDEEEDGEEDEADSEVVEREDDKSVGNVPDTIYQEEEEEEDDDDDEEEEEDEEEDEEEEEQQQSENQEEADDEEEEEEDGKVEEVSSSEESDDDLEVPSPEDQFKPTQQYVDPDDDSSDGLEFNANAFRPIHKGPPSDSSVSGESVIFVPRTGTSSSSSITTPQHMSPSPSSKRVIRRRRSSSKPQRKTTALSDSVSSPVYQQIAAHVSRQTNVRVRLNNNNNVLYNNKEKDRDNASTSSGSSAVDQSSSVNGSTSNRRHQH